MPHFVVTALDGSDPDAGARRAAARPAHLASIGGLVEIGAVVVGGALLDDAGSAIGSVVICDFPDRAALDAWLETDPYRQEGVWQRIDVKPFRIAVERDTARPR